MSEREDDTSHGIDRRRLLRSTSTDAAARLRTVAAKAGVRNFMTFLHNTFRCDGVRAITVLPGEADTPILENRPRPPAASERVHMLQPEDVAEAILMAVTLPPRACAQEIVVCPTRQRDTAGDVALSRAIGAP